MSNFLDHEKLSGIVSIGRYSNYPGFVVFSRVVGLDSEGLVSFLADYLIDVSSREL